MSLELIPVTEKCHGQDMNEVSRTKLTGERTLYFVRWRCVVLGCERTGYERSNEEETPPAGPKVHPFRGGQRVAKGGSRWGSKQKDTGNDKNDKGDGKDSGKGKGNSKRKK